MEILVINGSPKGKHSVTLQTVNYWQILYPEHNFRALHVGQTVKSLEKDFSKARQAIEKAELLLFSYPVYTFLAPSQLHRFIELLKQADLDLQGKWATQLSTSKHFYDITAHRYIQDICGDLGLKYIPGLSADMDDLTAEKGRREARDFLDHLLWCVQQGIYEPPAPPAPTFAPKPAAPAFEPLPADKGNVVIVADLRDNDTQLAAMVQRFRDTLGRKTRLVNIRQFPFQGGCLGCFKCAVTGKCVYTDGFDRYLREEIQTAEAIVFAFTVSDHSMGARFKLYDDRQFCNGHRTVTMGMPMGYLISGPYSAEQNLQTILEARAQVGGNWLAGVATDELDPGQAIDQLAMKLNYALEQGYRQPQNFYGIGGMKVFRDLIWLMQGMMKADHKFYKAHGQYDFPQKQWPRMLAMYAVGGLLSSPRLQKKMGSAMTEGMLMPYNKVLEQARKEQEEKKKEPVGV